MARQLLNNRYVIDPPRREPDGLVPWGQALALYLTQYLSQFSEAINHLQSRVGIEGHVTAAAAITSGTQFTVVNDSTGNYTVTIKDYGTPIIITVQAVNTAEIRWSVHTVSSTGFKIRFWDSASALVDTAFFFHARGYMEAIS